jgi:hypothetical protein
MSEVTPPPGPEGPGNPLPPLTPGPGAQSPLERRQMWRRYFAGLGLGTAVSVVVWLLGLKHLVATRIWWALVIVLAVKLMTGLLAYRSREWRSLGAGIVMSIALGFIIFFFGICTSDLTK